MARLRLQLPPFRSIGSVFAICLVVISVVVAIAKPFQEYVLLCPTLIAGNLWLWQFFSWVFIENSPTGVIFGALILWSIGGALEAMWGRRRFVVFSLGITVLAGLATQALWFVLPRLVGDGYAGGYVMTSAIWVAYGLHLGRSQTNFFGLPLTGNMLALIGAGFVFLNGAMSRAGIVTVIPGLFALLFTWLYMHGADPSALWLRFRSWQLDRDLKKRSAHLRSLEGGRRSGSGGSDKFLH